MSQGTLEFTRALNNIKSRDVQSVAARMCRVLRDFPRDVEPRSKTIDDDGIPRTISRVGYLFDTCWDESIGSSLSCVTDLTITQAQAIIEADYVLVGFLSQYENTLIGMGGIIDPEDLTRFHAAYNSIKNISASYTQSTMTYSGLGFTLDQKTLGEKIRPVYDVYEFLKDVVNTDLIVFFYRFNRWIGRPTDEIVPSYRTLADEVVVFAKQAMQLSLLLIEMILDMAHQVDAIETCSKGAAASDAITDFDNFDPSTDPDHYEKKSSYQMTGATKITTPALGWSKTFTFETGVNKRFAIVTSGGYRVCQIILNDANLDFSATKTPDAGATKCIYVSSDFTTETESSVQIIVSKQGMTASTSFDASKVEVYTNFKR